MILFLYSPKHILLCSLTQFTEQESIFDSYNNFDISWVSSLKLLILCIDHAFMYSPTSLISHVWETRKPSYSMALE